MKKLFKNNYDLEGIEILRLTRSMFFSKIFPLGNFDTGAGGRALVVLSVLHTFGRPFFTFYTKHEERLYPLIQRLRNLRR